MSEREPAIFSIFAADNAMLAAESMLKVCNGCSNAPTKLTSAPTANKSMHLPWPRQSYRQNKMKHKLMQTIRLLPLLHWLLLPLLLLLLLLYFAATVIYIKLGEWRIPRPKANTINKTGTTITHNTRITIVTCDHHCYYRHRGDIK